MLNNPLKTIQNFKQSIWQDDLNRKMLTEKELQRLIEEDGIRGVTSNPAIFKKAIDGSPEYDDEIRALARQGKSVEEIYEHLTVQDVQMAADLFRPLYDDSEGKYGFVSLEVNPHLAHDIDGTLDEARHLWEALSRPNVMIKIPATQEGLTCIEQLIAEGLNINVTLLFGLPRYRQVAQAYIRGLEARAAKKAPLERIASVASFFLSRIDVLVDPMLKKLKEDRPADIETVDQIYGKVAVASAKCAYQIYQEIFTGERFTALERKGARPQRLLWASTSTKEPEFSDIKYVEALIGPNTINTLPRETLDAYRDHGQPEQRLTDDQDEAHQALHSLAELGIDIDRLTQDLEDQGVDKFIKPYDSLMQTLEKERNKALI
ncbi:MAG: transaldolase [Desulfofustis sp.]